MRTDTDTKSKETEQIIWAQHHGCEKNEIGSANYRNRKKGTEKHGNGNNGNADKETEAKEH